MDQQNAALKAQEVQQKAQLEQAKMELESSSKQADMMMAEKEIALKEREMSLKEYEAQKPEPDPGMKIQADMQMARDRMEFDASEADKQRQVDLAKTIMAEFSGPEGSLTDPEQALNRASEIMERINEVIAATRMAGGNIPLAETTIMVAEGEEPTVLM
jgi:hypothetical protein